MGSWSLLTNHGNVLLTIAASPDARLRDISDATGITERWAHDILGDLVEAGYVTKRRVGRRNRYEIHADKVLRDEVIEHRTVGDVLAILAPRDAHDAGG